MYRVSAILTLYCNKDLKSYIKLTPYPPLPPPCEIVRNIEVERGPCFTIHEHALQSNRIMQLQLESNNPVWLPVVQIHPSWTVLGLDRRHNLII